MSHGNSRASMVNESSAAAFLGCSVKCIRAWRSRGCGPIYSKIGRLVRYDPADLEEWLRGRRVYPRSKAAELENRRQQPIAEAAHE